ncbi:MAG: CDP-glucose 4,6-dehydratase [Granulosicoccus sp.]|nr:CDP-glucose 4,6-dehydratase [Granulosicoccus sp.]
MTDRTQPKIDATFWRNKSVLVTGHTGFKGGWLSLWLSRLGSQVHGYSLAPHTEPNFFHVVNVDSICSSSTIANIQDQEALHQTIQRCQPQIIFHLAAQSLVHQSYAAPVDTVATNVMGTVNLLEAARQSDSVSAIVIVTSDKCYDNREWPWGYRENEALGGHDPYSASKACAEIITKAWQLSFFNADNQELPKCSIATARAGNVIGGGDWSQHRLVPDVLASLDTTAPLDIRNPQSVRPWQHVLEPLAGYMILAQRLFTEGMNWAEPWNFGPADTDNTTVSDLVQLLLREMDSDKVWSLADEGRISEANLLRLDSTKARQRLGWHPCWNLGRAVREIAIWHGAWMSGKSMFDVSVETLDRYSKDSAQDRSFSFDT